MNFNRHSELIGLHALFSASKYHWINYDAEKAATTYINFLATARGTELHEFAARCIVLGQKLPKSKKALNLYVNDAIGFRMTPEQPLYYSENFFGTADAIVFRDNFLRIHDLKTGVSPVSMNQLKVYTALFCLEYKKHPGNIGIELRIYQDGIFEEENVLIEIPEEECILSIMEKIITFDKVISEIKNKEG